MKSDCKSFDVFNFSSEDELAELDAANRLSKFRNPSDVDKYNFLANVARGNDYQSQDMSNIQCVDVDDQNCENALSRFSLRSGAETPEQMCAIDDFVLVNSASHEQQHPQFTLDEFKAESFSAQLESRSSTPEAASPDNSSQLNFALHDSPSHDESVDAIPDSDESMSAGSTSTSSHILGDDVTLDEHGLGRGPSSGHCFGTWESGNRNVAVRPDYVTYRGRYCTESEIIFTSSSIELKSSTADGKDGTFCFEWGIDDIVDINSQWSERLRVAMVKIRLISKDEMQAEGGQSTSGIEELQFAAVELNWYKKQEEIMSLGGRYKELWNVVFDSVIGRGEEALPGKNGVCIPRRRYLPNFDEPFEEVVYPKGDADAVTISKQDVDLLQPDTFVNDTIIDFYIKYLKNEIRQTDRHRFHFFNSFFFRKLIDLDKDPSSAFEGRAAFQRVRKWTRKVNLFEKDYVFIPVNFNYHWSLIVICHPGEVANCQAEDMEKPLKVPCILHMDSIKGSHTGLKDLVQSYLWEEWKEKHKEACEDLSSKFFNLRFVPLELPQQQNSFDCGLFLLHYVERFLKDAPPNLSPFKISKFSSFLNVDWFPAAEPSLKRVKIQNLIREILKKENSPDPCNGNPCSSISNYPASNSEIETGVELISERCSPSKSCPGKLSSSPAGDGIEITLLPSSSQCAGDSGLVLREFFEEGATAGSYLDGQFPNFDLQPCYSEFKSAMSAVEEDEEAGEQCDYSQANETGTCVFPFSQSGLASDDDSEVDVRDNHIENPNTDEEIDQPRSPSMENEERLTETPASAPSEIFDVADSQSPDPTVHSNGKVDCLAEFDQQNEDIRTAEECFVGDNLVSELDGLKVSDRINGESVLESGKETPAKRSGDDTVLESDEQQPSKKLRLSNDLQF